MIHRLTGRREPAAIHDAPDHKTVRRWCRRVAVILLLSQAVTGGWLLVGLMDAENAQREHRFWLLCHEDSTAIERAALFHNLLAAGNHEWRAARLYGLNLSDAFLPGEQVQEADLSGGIFTRAILAGGNFSRSRFHQADFMEADLSRAELAGAEFYRAVMQRVNFRQANLRGAGFQVADARHADFRAADLSETHLLMADLSDANLTGANLSGARLEATVMRRANLHLARFDGAKIDDADFTGSNWWQARGLTAEQTAMLRKKFPPPENPPTPRSAALETSAADRDPAAE